MEAEDINQARPYEQTDDINETKKFEYMHRQAEFMTQMNQMQGWTGFPYFIPPQQLQLLEAPRPEDSEVQQKTPRAQRASNVNAGYGYPNPNFRPFPNPYQFMPIGGFPGYPIEGATPPPTSLQPDTPFDVPAIGLSNKQRRKNKELEREPGSGSPPKERKEFRDEERAPLTPDSNRKERIKDTDDLPPVRERKEKGRSGSSKFVSSGEDSPPTKERKAKHRDDDLMSPKERRNKRNESFPPSTSAGNRINKDDTSLARPPPKEEADFHKESIKVDDIQNYLEPSSIAKRPSVHEQLQQQLQPTPEVLVSAISSQLSPFKEMSYPIKPISSVGENERVAALHALGILDSGDQPRLDKITQMTLRLLGGSCCVLSLVDVDRVIWKSSSWAANTSPQPPKEEARYESFCSWVVQDETGRGITILDNKTDPRCTHMRAKEGFEFYAGVPVLSSDKKKIGVLSIRGPARAQISVVDMNILFEMSVWASGELDTISQHRSLETKHQMLEARIKINLMIDAIKDTEKEVSTTVLQKALDVVRESLGATFVLLLKISAEPTGLKSSLITFATSATHGLRFSLIPGTEMFHELTMLTLQKDQEDAPLVLDQLSTGPVTKDVDIFLNKKILRCATEIIWSSRRPSAILATFYEGTYHYLAQHV